jgi:hypothetical protein
MVDIPRIKSLLSATVAIAMLGILPACGSALPQYGCHEADQELVPRLERLPILDVHPDGAVPVDKYSGCDADDSFASAGRYYRAPVGRNDVLAFYRAATKRDGWRYLGYTPGSPAPNLAEGEGACYSKDVKDAIAYLRVWFPGDKGDAIPDSRPLPTSTAGASVYGLELTAAHEDRGGC